MTTLQSRDWKSDLKCETLVGTLSFELQIALDKEKSIRHYAPLLPCRPDPQTPNAQKRSHQSQACKYLESGEIRQRKLPPTA